MDSNCWLGDNIIPGDSNKITNSNGRMFKNFMQRNKDLHLVNAMSICEGIVTRQRVTDLLNEKSAIDLFLVCGKLKPFIQKMVVDEKQENPLTNFNGFNRGKKITESDHNRLELILKIETPQIKPQREELFNFKSVLGQNKFFDLTNNSEKLRKCFKTEENFLNQASKFEKTLTGVFHHAFKKIRGKKQKQDKTEIGDFMNKRKRLKCEIKVFPNPDAINSLEQVEKQIASLISNKNRDRVNKVLQNISNTDSSCNSLGMWKEIKKSYSLKY